MLDKATAIVDCFRPDGGAFRLTELAARSGLTKTTAFRLCGDLVRLGW
ncbi:helix-turn-helix domain-containing protein, partial [Streptomyces fulvoviolaceus]